MSDGRIIIHIVNVYGCVYELIVTLIMQLRGLSVLMFSIQSCIIYKINFFNVRIAHGYNLFILMNSKLNLSSTTIN